MWDAPIHLPSACEGRYAEEREADNHCLVRAGRGLARRTMSIVNNLQASGFTRVRIRRLTGHQRPAISETQ
jgi:hypothetical protein